MVVSYQCFGDMLLRGVGTIKGHQLPPSHPDTVTYIVDLISDKCNLLFSPTHTERIVFHDLSPSSR